MPTLRLRYFFDPGSGVCLWAGDAATREALGDYPVAATQLPLSRNTACWLAHLIAWFDTSLDWDDPGQPGSPWPPGEAARFRTAADAGLARLRAELPAERFLLIDARTPLPRS